VGQTDYQVAPLPSPINLVDLYLNAIKFNSTCRSTPYSKQSQPYKLVDINFRVRAENKINILKIGQDILKMPFTLTSDESEWLVISSEDPADAETLKTF
jgi:uncharacterized Fe-S radical SAM superfamily protein PflX